VSDVRGRRTAGRIVETEAYIGPHDPAAHGFGDRRTQRNARLFGAPGTAYVFFTYGMHWCLNAVTERDGYPAAVLLRALEPIEGIEVMRRRRGRRADVDLASGPAKLAQALAVTGKLDGHDLTRRPLQILPGRPVLEANVEVSPRIGIRRAADWPLRFVVRGSRFASR
jgi:DNA-3-methyladenine glycosylase